MQNEKTVILQIYHRECDTEDDYIQVVGTNISVTQVVDEFKQALCASKRDAEHTGCRFSWVDHVMSVMAAQYQMVVYCKNQEEDALIEID